MTQQSSHSPLGASGAERWMNCPGSVAFLKRMDLPESDDPSYRLEGTAMHDAAEVCLTEGLDTWEIIGREFEGGIVIDAAMADAVQVYVDYCRSLMEGALDYQIEYFVSSPVHPQFYGRLDFAAEHPDVVHSVDLKGGEGIIVDPEENPQLKYYVYGLIEEHPQWPDDLTVRLTIVQPRGIAATEKIRTWDTTVGAVRTWVADVLVPAMLATEFDNSLDAGEWCRFCPAKLVCPLLTSLFGAAAKHNAAEIVNIDDRAIGRNYQYLQAVKFYIKALQDETMRRLNAGRSVPGTKLVNKKADRVFNPGADLLAREKFGDKAWVPAKAKSPAQIELLPGGKEFVREFAHTPQTGYTVALESDKRPAVTAQTSAEAFAGAVKKVVDTGGDPA